MSAELPCGEANWVAFVSGFARNQCNFLDPSRTAVRPKWGLWVFGTLHKVPSTGTHCSRDPGVAAQGAFSSSVFPALLLDTIKIWSYCVSVACSSSEVTSYSNSDSHTGQRAYSSSCVDLVILGKLVIPEETLVSCIAFYSDTRKFIFEWRMLSSWTFLFCVQFLTLK